MSFEGLNLWLLAMCIDFESAKYVHKLQKISTCQRLWTDHTIYHFKVNGQLSYCKDYANISIKQTPYALVTPYNNGTLRISFSLCPYDMLASDHV